MKKKTTALDWNRRHPVGTAVRYYPVQGLQRCMLTRTRSGAFTLSSGHAVVLVEGKTGGVSLEHVVVEECA